MNGPGPQSRRVVEQEGYLQPPESHPRALATHPGVLAGGEALPAPVWEESGQAASVPSPTGPVRIQVIIRFSPQLPDCSPHGNISNYSVARVGRWELDPESYTINCTLIV